MLLERVFVQENAGDERESMLFRPVDNLEVPTLEERGLCLRAVIELWMEDVSVHVFCRTGNVLELYRD